MYTKKGRPIVVDNLYCKKCFSDSDSESEAEGNNEATIETEDKPAEKGAVDDKNSPYPQPSKEGQTEQPTEQSPASTATELQLSVLSDASKPDLSKSLLPEVSMKKNPSMYSLNVMMDRSTSCIEYIFSLNWLHFTLMKKDGIRLLIPVIGMIVWLGIVIIYSSVAGLFTMPQCDDGSFSYYHCIDNSNPPTWDMNSDISFVTRGTISFVIMILRWILFV